MTFKPTVVKSRLTSLCLLTLKPWFSLGFLQGRETLCSATNSYMYLICTFLHFIIRKHSFIYFLSCINSISCLIGRWTSLTFWLYSSFDFYYNFNETSIKEERRACHPSVSPFPFPILCQCINIYTHIHMPVCINVAIMCQNFFRNVQK